MSRGWREWFRAGCFGRNPLRFRRGIPIGLLAATVIWLFSSVADLRRSQKYEYTVDRYRFDRVGPKLIQWPGPSLLRYREAGIGLP
jgi:hypothetical protein